MNTLMAQKELKKLLNGINTDSNLNGSQIEKNPTQNSPGHQFF